MNSRCHRRFWHFCFFLSLFLCWAPFGYASVSGTYSSAGIQATATVISPFGLVAPDAERADYLLYHPMKAGSVSTYTEVNGKHITFGSRGTVTLVNSAILEGTSDGTGGPTVITVIYTEN